MPTVPLVHWVERADAAKPSHNGSALTPEDLINQAERHFNTSLSSILIAWGLTLLGSFLVLALFSSLRDKYDVIYKPRIAACKDQAEEDQRQGIAGQDGIWRPGIPEEANGALAWLKPLWHDLRIEFGIRTGRRVRQRDFAALRLLGLDAVTFLQFLRLLRWLFLTITILAAVPLIIINYFLSTHSEFGFTSADPEDLTSTASLAIQNFNATAVVTDMQTITAAVIFKNLAKDPAAWRSHNIMGFIALLVICALNTVPLLGIQILANLKLLAETVPRLKQLQQSSIILKGLIAIASGIVPPAIAAMFSYLLPFIIRYLSRWSGALTRGQLDKEVISRLFAFLLLWNFFFFSCIGVIYETGLTLYSSLSQDKSWADAFASLGDIPGKISKSYISQSSYWLSWFPIRSAVCCLQLLQLPRWFLKAYELLYAYRDGLTGNTEHAVSQPVNFETASSPDEIHPDVAAIEYSHVMFAMVVALVLTPLAPLVAIVGTIYFWTASVVFQNQLLYVENAKETDGAVWQTVIHRLLVATVIMQLLMCLTISLKAQDPVMSVLSFLPVGCIAYLKHFISSYRSFAYFFQHSEDTGATEKRRRKQRGHGHGIGRLDGYGKELFEAHSWLPRWKWTDDELKTLKDLSGKHPGLKDIVPELREKEPEPEEKPKPKRSRRLWRRGKSKNHDGDREKDRSRTRSKSESSSRRKGDRDWDEKRSRNRHRRHH